MNLRMSSGKVAWSAVEVLSTGDVPGGVTRVALSVI